MTEQEAAKINLDVPTQPFPPTQKDQERLTDYSYYEKLFFGNHYEAFKLRINDPNYNQTYAKLRHVIVNFAGLLSRVSADYLFSEKITVTFPDGDQKFGEALIRKNKLHTQLYESALSNSYLGDALFKLRTGKRHKNFEENTVIIEDISPRVYFPKIDPFNIRAMPEQEDLAWLFNIKKESYVRKEIHEPGKIFNKVFLFEDGVMKNEVSLTIAGVPNLLPELNTLVDDKSLVVHIPNWKVGSRWNGISDYNDLDSIFFAINNRLTKVDNVLDKHTDPILMVPAGILDKEGRPIKKDNRIIEMGDGEDGVPQYIVWDASLENAFKEIDKLIESFMMVAEISPDVFGMGKGSVESGRALKFKLLRTIAKVSRKKLYYDPAIKEILYIAQVLAKKHDLSVDGLKITKDPVMPEIVWEDGLPTDETELLDNETKAIDMGIQTRVKALMKVANVNEETAKKLVKEAKEEGKSELIGLGFNKTPIKAPVPPSVTLDNASVN